ncbi:MAG: hypothetical protein L6V88_01865 [Anaerotruncus sp.]|nr:MAG: hypothetical protein L6V88_01865 [Anaerotruncus sp.]
MDNNYGKNRTAVALGDFDGMHLAHKTVVTGAEKAIIYCVHNKFSLLQKSIFEKRYPNAVFLRILMKLRITRARNLFKKF